MHLVLTGATGLVGSGVLHSILSLPATTAASKRLNRLSIVSRRAEIPLLSHPDRPTANTFTKIEVIPHSDFKTYPAELLSKLQPDETDGKLGVIWALGISQTEVKSEAEYVEITKEYALEAAKALSTSLSSPPESKPSSNKNTETHAKTLNFIYVSGEGATHTPSFLTPLFGRVKGSTETSLFQLSQTTPFSQNLHVYNVRPAAVDAINQAAVHDLMSAKDQNRSVGYRVLKASFLPLLRRGLMSGTWSPTEELGRVFVELACGDGASLLSGSHVGVEGWEGRVVRNVGIRSLFREYSSASDS